MSWKKRPTLMNEQRLVKAFVNKDFTETDLRIPLTVVMAELVIGYQAEIVRLSEAGESVNVIDIIRSLLATNLKKLGG